MEDVGEVLREAAREHYGWVLARLIRSMRDLELAEDATQQAFEAALASWPEAGIPESPRAWLSTTARNKAVDTLRRRSLQHRKADELGWLARLDEDGGVPDDPQAIRDDMLRLVFTCCHPALAEEVQVALTLKVVAGLTTEEIAAAFVTPTATIAQRIVRAKKKIKAAAIPYRVPDTREFGERLTAVLAVAYLVFNEGYAASGGEELIRGDLCRHGIRLAEALAQLLPEQAEVRGLLALMLLQDSRREARVDAAGEVVLLEDQDRGLWDQAQIARACDLTRGALSARPGRYVLQAAIAAVHAEARSSAETDWPQILGLYELLHLQLPNPVVALNRAVAVAMAVGLEAGLEAVEALAGDLQEYYLWHSSRAELLRRMGRLDDAAASFRRARQLCSNEVVRSFIDRQLLRC